MGCSAFPLDTDLQPPRQRLRDTAPGGNVVPLVKKLQRMMHLKLWPFTVAVTVAVRCYGGYFAVRRYGGDRVLLLVQVGAAEVPVTFR
jgi:hypothetical protein